VEVTLKVAPRDPSTVARNDWLVVTRSVFYGVNVPEEEAWREQCRQQLERDVMTRIKYGFCHVHKPVLDDAPFRAFKTMAEYRDWCERSLPAYLGYRRVKGNARE
jgi:hypothetical protein